MSDIKDRIESALQEIRPFLQNDGGDIKLHSVIDDVEVRVVLQLSLIHISEPTRPY